MNAVVATHDSYSSQLPAALQSPSYNNFFSIWLLTMLAIIVNSIYSMLIYNEVRRLRRHITESEESIVTGGRLLYSIIHSVRESLRILLEKLEPAKDKTKKIMHTCEM